MAYTSLYRRFRPRTFTALVGQEHISRTLINAVSNNNFSHAYLFSGPRGTGKTSTAKILARAVNCLEQKKGEPCGKCAACLRSLAGESMDILEIDAASNRGIDEIRDLRERVKFAPAQEKYKVYIIDEVHMLTSEAFNALLKTLEEPPVHVLFILATTEPHKIPLTVLSRCQRFDFRRIPLTHIIAHLQGIADEENIGIDVNALELISRKADGGLRDAINLLDQCRGFSKERITIETVNSVLGLVDEAFISFLAEELLLGDLAEVLRKTTDLTASGLDLRQVLYDLLDYLRRELLAKISANNNLSSALSELPSSRYLQVIRILGEAESRLRYSLQPRITLELALIEACGVRDDVIECKNNSVKKGTRNQLKQPISETKNVRELKEKNRSRTEPEILETKRLQEKEDDNCLCEKTNEKVSLPVDLPPRGKDQNKNDLDIERILMLWPKLLDMVSKSDQNGTMAFLCWAKPVAYKANKLILEFSPDFELHMKALCNKLIHKSLVEEKLAEITGEKIIISGRLGEAEKLQTNDDGIQGEINF